MKRTRDEQTKRTCPTSRTVSVTTNLFDDIPDDMIAEIAQWILATRRHESFPRVIAIRDMMRFALTCQRMFRILNNSWEVWSVIDIGAIIHERSKYVYSKELIIAAEMLSIPQIGMCRRFSLVNELPNAHILALMLSMPRIKKLEIGFGSLMRCDRSIFEEIRSKDIRLRLNKMLMMTKEDFRHVQDMIESLTELEYLKYSGISYPDMSIDQFLLPPSLRKIVIEFANVNNMFGKTFEMVRSLTIENCVGDISRVIESFPMIKSLSIRAHRNPLRKEESSLIWKTCAHLEELKLSASMNSSLSMESFVRSTTLKKLNLNVSGSGVWETVCRNCPNIVELHMGGQIQTDPTDIRALIELKQLRILEMFSRIPNDEKIVAAFSDLGNSDGVPFTKLKLKFVHVDIRNFFASRRCHELYKIVFWVCSFSNPCISDLIENARDSLKILKIMNCEISSSMIDYIHLRIPECRIMK